MNDDGWDDGWLVDLRAALRRHGVESEVAGQVVTEAAQHLRDSGEPAWRVFGPPDRYASAVAASVRPSVPAARSARRSGPLRLAARHISKRYRRRPVLIDVNLAVHAGEVAAVIGANGCGKSTFLQICAGMVTPDRGQVYIDGTVGYCPQDGGTYDFLLPDEHFVLVGAGRGMSRAEARSHGRAGSARLNWDSSDSTVGRHLSGGTRQKLNVVMTEFGDPDVLLLDEPYQGFDRDAYLDFWSEVWRWRDHGKAVVVVTHRLDHLDDVDTVLDLTGHEKGLGIR